MTFTLDLVTNEEVELAFLKANANLLKTNSVKSTDELIMLWKKVYNAELILPDKIVFSNNKDLTMFLLKWS